MRNDRRRHQDIAVVGMSCRFPGAKNYTEFWDNLINGRNSIQSIPDSRWTLESLEDKGIPHWCGLIDGVEEFDNGFFNISPREAKSMDPQQRLLLQEAWRCIENSGVPLSDMQEALTGVYVGVMTGDYHQYMSDPGRKVDSYAALGNYDCILANRLSYFLKFEGPSIALDAACASSLVSIHEACLSLRAGNIKYALAGGVNLCVHPWKHQAFASSRMLSPDGQCKTFDIKANGYVPGDGVGVVLLQPLEDAIAERNNVLGVIKGSAVGHVGDSLSITAPRVKAQRDVLVSAYKDATINPREISYIEAHGTGTSLGDPIEIESIKQAFLEYTDKKGFCSIGSVKTNVGHLEGAAGIAGLIKVLLMMKNREVPKMLNFETPNPLIDFRNSPVKVAKENKLWKSTEPNKPLLAGISSFGFGGVNSHLVVESFEEKSLPIHKNTDQHFFQLSAKSEKSLLNLLDSWTVQLREGRFDNYRIEDICKSLKVGREDQEYRLCFNVSDVSGIKTRLNNGDYSIVKSGSLAQTLVLFDPEIVGDIESLKNSIPIDVDFLKIADLALQQREKEQKTSEIYVPMDVETDGERDQLLRSFIVSYSLGSALIALGLEPEKIDVSSGNLMSSLCLSEIVDDESALDFMLGYGSAKNLKVKFPRYYIEGWKKGEEILKSTTITYFTDLYAGLKDVDKKGLVSLRRMALDLYQHQYTFKRMIDEWEYECNRRNYSLNLEANNEKDYLLSDFLTLIAIKSSIAAINNKWDITREDIGDKFLVEVVLLLTHGVIAKGVMIEWLDNFGEMDVVSPQDLIDKTKDIRSKLPLLDESYRQVWEAAELDDVLLSSGKGRAQRTENKKILEIAMAAESYPLFEAGSGGNDLSELLQALWLRGVCVDWKGIYPVGTYNRLPLPSYEFDVEKYWYDESRNWTVKESDNNTVGNVESRNLERVGSEAPLNIPVREKVEKTNVSNEIYIKQVISDIVEIDVAKINTDKSLFSMGIDSISQQELISNLELRFGKLSPTLIYEYPNVDALCEYLQERGHEKKLLMDVEENRTRIVLNTSVIDVESLAVFLRDSLARLLESNADDISEEESFFSMGVDSLLAQEFIDLLSKKYSALPDTILYEYPNIETLSAYLVSHKVDVVKPTRKNNDTDYHFDNIRDDDVAVIGMGGRFPQARNIAEFWDNLLSGKNCIETIPSARWRYQDYAVEGKGPAGLAYGKWGGFIDDVDKFDPLFFGISPKEAVQMDPQQRVFLECCWGVMEQAGYGNKASYKDSTVGLFVGAMWNEYSAIANEEGFQKQRYSGPGSIYWAIANRVSYLMDFRGPSLAIDTACSSSLVSLHYACQSILSGDCDMAIAGGVNLSIHPSKYIYLSQAKFLSSEGLCRSFGEGGDGYVPGEGVGGVLLKSAKKAVEDGDYIYGIVKSTTVNHGGKATGFTVPNPEAQANLVKKSIEKAGISANDIDYVECHGTGTSLGDPIEIAGLTRAFSEVDRKCPVGSVKSNIGHLEAAAGIAALVKVLLSMQADVIPKSLHSTIKNTKIDFENSPFYVVQENELWRKSNSEGRHASISSFGAGGANAHTLISSFDNKKIEMLPIDIVKNIFVLSAKTPSSLKGGVNRLVEFLRGKEGFNNDLMPHLAYSLQCRRDEFIYRVAFISRDKLELIEQLDTYLKGEESSTEYVYGKAKKINRKEKVFPVLSKYSEDGYLYSLALSWIAGKTLEWPIEVEGVPLRYLEIPSYVFDKDRYWLGEVEDVKNVSEIDSSVTSISNDAVTKQHFGYHDPCFIHHNIHGENIMPGVVCLDLLLDALRCGDDYAELTLFDVAWLLPLTPKFGPNGVSAKRADTVGSPWAVESSVDGGSSKMFCRARNGELSSNAVEIAAEKSKVIESRTHKYFEKNECYKRFSQLGFVYGDSFQTVTYWKGNDLEALSFLENPEPQVEGRVIDPGMLDGALQTTLLLLDEKRKYIPYSIGRCVYKRSMEKSCYAHVTLKKNREGIAIFDILVTDGQGQLMVAMYDFCIKDIGANPNFVHVENEISYFSESWTYAEETTQTPTSFEDIIVLVDNDRMERTFDEASANRTVFVKKGVEFKKENSRSYYIKPDNQNDYVLLLDDLARQGVKTSLVICLWGFIANRDADLNVLEDSMCGEHLFMLSKAWLDKKPKNKMRVLSGFNSITPGCRPLMSAINGFAKTIAKETQKLDVVSVDFAGEIKNTDYMEVMRLLLSDARNCVASDEIRYVENIRYQKQLTEVLNDQQRLSDLCIRSRGVYLITGGLGGLGLLFARHMIKQYGATVVLVGRSELKTSSIHILEQLGEYSGTTKYIRADISDEKQVANMLAMIRKEFGEVNGVIHSAGITRDSSLVNKNIKQWRDVISTKVWGTLYLNKYTQSENLDFFVMFSSVTALLGNPGQSDYGFANRFMDGFADWKGREQPDVRTVSINWPLWKEGGMQVRPEIEKFIEKTMGIETLETIDGLSIFEKGLTLPYSNFLAARGHLVGAKDVVEGMKNNEKDIIDVSSASSVERDDIENNLVEFIADIIEISKDMLEIDEELVQYGFDSVSFGQLSEKINNRYDVSMTPALFYEYVNISQLVDYLNTAVIDEQSQNDSNVFASSAVALEEPNLSYSRVNNSISEFVKNTVSDIVGVEQQIIELDMELTDCGFDSVTYADLADRINRRHGTDITPALFYELSTIGQLIDHISEYSVLERDIDSEVEPQGVVNPQGDVSHRSNDLYDNSPRASRVEPSPIQHSEPREESLDGMAIVGMDGVFPGADNLKEFWHNLVEGKNSIIEVPKERWNWKEYYGDAHEDGDKTQVKWGGFIQNADKFDAEFFGISPREAELMDPQQRIMLQVSWGAFEDAGYPIEKSEQHNVGVFIGASNQDYVELMRLAGTDIEPHSATGNALSIISNRISYAFNFTGPSETVDTACSSSLVALNRAITSINSGECEMALVGGVNLMFSPSTYISFDKAGMLSHDGQCKVFDENANGYVRGEGAGTVIIKPLRKAMEDGDQIYSVIRSTAVNHGGKANSLTAPNPTAQGDLIYKAYKSARVDPASVSYIETHGTGTALGDPIEINGLKKGFEKLQSLIESPSDIPKSFIGLGALKSNIGHLETAAGIAGLIKVTLCLKNRKLVKNINFHQLNPYIHIEDSPFYILSEAENWRSEGAPLRAGLSSFGFGGVNAHAVIEEFTKQQTSIESTDRILFLFSAKQKEQLNRYVESFISFLKSDSTININAAAYTLQCGRLHHQQRLAVLASNRQELLFELDRYLKNEANGENVIEGSTQKNGAALELIDCEEGVVFQDLLLKNRKYAQLGKLWVNGISVDWKKLYGNNVREKISLPTYPFRKDRHWISSLNQKIMKSNISNDVLLHPLMHHNYSSIDTICYGTRFTGKEVIFEDHQVDGRSVLPGVSLIEMLRFAIENNTTDTLYNIEDLVWIKPITPDVEGGYKVIILREYDQLKFMIKSFDQSQLYAEGQLNTKKAPVNNNRVPLDGIRSKLDKKDVGRHYKRFVSVGIAYGSSFRVVSEIYSDENEAISYLQVKENDSEIMLLQPELLDGALQSVSTLINTSEKNVLYIPFSVERISIYGALNSDCVCYVKPSKFYENNRNGIAFDISVCDPQGVVILEFYRAFFAPLKQTTKTGVDTIGHALLESVWS